ncbi:hypothetical protein [Sphingomonas nostoxanthinifaciens]|uniref:hypothetical protein n=1 Tax=Sphingomonas nostoxanthinifaciens TaxID=2872652 RepID=UPI001CC1EEA7|nr:hypothetical protein [Sphingomonas nostoxanthinifaciens]UAK25514.1 hypothetical protein K8P63_04945 [Sphingomonas nostoxanthinifaciens]
MAPPFPLERFGRMSENRPTTDELRALIVEILQGATDDDRWDRLVGPVLLVPIWLHIKSNWDIDLFGETADRRAMVKAVEIVRGLYPHARP